MVPYVISEIDLLAIVKGGDPPKGARAMYEIAMMDEPPTRIVLGSDACRLSQIERVREAG